MSLVKETLVNVAGLTPSEPGELAAVYAALPSEDLRRLLALGETDPVASVHGFCELISGFGAGFGTGDLPGADDFAEEVGESEDDSEFCRHFFAFSFKPDLVKFLADPAAAIKATLADSEWRQNLLDGVAEEYEDLVYGADDADDE